MIYLVGMSHAINVLKAASQTGLPFTHENWASMQTNGRFFDISTKSGLLPNDTLKAFIASPSLGWGFAADFNVLPNGQKQVVAVEGYVALLRSIDTEQNSNTFVSLIHGNELSALSLVQHPEPFDFCLNSSDDQSVIAGARPIPLEVVERQIDHALRHTVACLTMARILLPRMRIVHVLPPPPVASSEDLLMNPEVFGEAISKQGLTPLSIRVKYYKLMAQRLQIAATANGIELLPPPTSSLTASGALKRQFVYGATHANEAYGSLVMQQIARL